MKNILANLKEWFSKYVAEFKFDDPMHQEMIDLKYQHTYRVCDNIVGLGKNLQLNDENLIIAEIIALFHDVGRFDQFKQYYTFVDRKSVNHAHWGAKVLEEKRVLNVLDKEDKNVIEKAILNHNAYSLPDGISEKEIFFSGLIRDADKLDIMHVILESLRNPESRNPAVSLDLPDEDIISSNAVTAVMNGTLVKLKDVKTVHDYKILLVGWIYDINFSYTLKEMKTRSYIEELINMLPQNDDIKKMKEKVCCYIESKISASKL